MPNLVHAVRSLCKSPVFLLVAVLTIAIGISANTVLFSVYDRVVLHRVTIPDTPGLIAIWSINPQLNINAATISWPRYEEIRDGVHGIASIGASGFENFTLTGRGDPAQLNSLRVTASFFPTLGVMPAQGRNFTSDEDVPNGPLVCVISHELWQTRFGGEPFVGKAITLNGQSWQVVGIMPASLSVPFDQVQVFVPRLFEMGGLPNQVRNGVGMAQAIARLRPGVTVPQVRDELAAISRVAHDRFPTRLDANNTSEPRVFVETVVGNLRPTFNALLGAVVFVLLIACANVTALFLARLTARKKEIAVRQSLGATRGRLVAEFVVESFVFSGVAGVVGTFFAQLALSAIPSVVAPGLIPAGLTLNGRVLLFTVAISAATALLVGLVPAVQASRGSPIDVLKDTQRGSSSARAARFRSVLIVAEVALSVVLLVGSALLLVSFLRLLRTAPGYEPRGVATAFVGVSPARYRTPDQQSQFFDQVVERLRAQSGVTDAAAAFGIPFGGVYPQAPYGILGRPVVPMEQRPVANFVLASDGYFHVMHIPIVAGRTFNSGDRNRSPAVCIVNESFARRLFPGESALGQIMLRGRDAEIRAEIVGISGDVKSNGLNNPSPDEIYYSMRQRGFPAMSVLARTAGGANALQGAIRSAVAAADSNQAISFFMPLERLVADSLGVQRMMASLTSVFALIALLLSAVGLYSLVAYAVSQRAPEIGIRMALGAQRGQVIWLVMRGGLRSVVAGLGIGLIAAAAGGRLMTTLLYDVQPLNPWIYGGVAMLFTAIAALACLIPSLRAARIDPIRALRLE